MTMRHNQDSGYDRNNDYDRNSDDRNSDDRNSDDRRNRNDRREEGWHEDERHHQRPPGRPNNNPQDRWPDFIQSYESAKLHGRPENLRGRRYSDDAYRPNDEYRSNRYHFDERDPRYMDEENRRRQENQGREEGGREADHRSQQPQFSSDRWPDEELHQPRSHPNRHFRRDEDDDARFYDERRRR